MMPIRDVVIFPYMMTPFVVGRESSVHALEVALAGDKKIFLATQHDASIDEPKPGDIFQVGTIVNIVQSLKLPDGNIKVDYRVKGAGLDATITLPGKLTGTFVFGGNSTPLHPGLNTIHAR